MQIDTSQPIMFDTDAMPGKGAGTWQLHPSTGVERRVVVNQATDRVSVIARLTVAILIGGGLVIASITNLFL
jgi:hypothetical protein